MKKQWVQFQTTIARACLPRLLYAGADEVADASYCWKGKDRDRKARAVFQFTLGGEGRLTWRKGTLPLNAGDAFCYNLGDPGYSYFYPRDGKAPWSFIYCAFVGMTETVTRLVRAQGPVFRLGEASPAARKLQALLESVKQAAPSLDASRHFEVCAAIVGELIRCAEGTGVGGKGEALVRRAEELLRQAAGAPFGLDALAAELQVTPEHLCRAFRARLGITPKGYHDELRLGQVCDRLLNTTATIKEIALDAGFSDLSHFCKFFKARRGLTPGAFRNHAAFRH